ncbi:site-specific integrase [Edaphobacter paludis]|uniref:Site-specific integrase n=1 Tax=Edaphobacter paludis TaxID=3035702 RepID=A0AAU7D6B6_9BACT
MARQAKKASGVYEKYPGSGVFYVQYRLKAALEERPGKLIRKKIGTRQQAIDYLDKVKHIRASGDGVIPATAKLPVRTTAELREDAQGVMFGELCEGLLKHIANNPTEYKDQKNPPQRIGLIKKSFGHRHAAAIKPSEIRDWLDSLDELAPATKNRYRAMFSAIFTYGKERDKIQVNPARDVKQRKVNNGVIRYLSPAEEKRLRVVLQKDVDACGPRNERLRKHMLHRIYELDVALGTGMRRGEQYSLTWRDVNFERGELIARDTKNGTDRTVIMIDDVVEAMKALKALSLTRKRRSTDKPNESPSDVVFGIGDNKRWWENALSEAKIQNFRWHDLRHTFCSRLAQSGASLKVIQEAAGHKTIQMAARYAHMDQTTMRNAMAILNRRK